ncbi:S24 family peptidase [Flavobacterium sp.]
METNFTNIKERILYITEFKGIGKEKFFEDLGVTYGNFKGKAKEKSLSSDVLAKIVTKYKDINPEWLLTGNGSVLKDQTLHIVDEPGEIYLLKNEKIKNGNQLIPLYNIEATAGIVTLFTDSTQGKPIDFIQIPGLPKCDGAVYISGDSMYPLLKSGDIVMYKQIKNIKEGICWGEMYLISIDHEGDEMVMVKYLQKSDEGTDFIKMVSQNSHHQDRDISMEKVRALALIKASIRINSMS